MFPSFEVRFSWSLVILAFGLTLWFSGCGTKDISARAGSGSDATVSSSKEGADLIIPIAGGGYLFSDEPSFAEGPMNVGLHAIGDLDGDGLTDLVVAVHYQASSSAATPAEQTGIEAFSGKNGTRLWQLRGKHDRGPANPTSGGYFLGPMAVIGDLNADGVNDLYCREGWYKKSALLISGKTGKQIGRRPISDHPAFLLPLRSAADQKLIFAGRQRDSLGVEIFSGKELSPLQQKHNLWPGAGDAVWALPEFHDVDGDGVADCLVRTSSNKDTMKFAVLSGKDFTVLKEFSVNARMGGKRSYLRIADLNGDGVKDFVYACSSGGGAQGLKSYLRAVSGADGATIWEILGSYLPFGMQSTVKSQGKEIDSGREVQFQGPLVAIPDLDGDGMEEIVTAVMTDGTYSHKALAIFSGKTGKLIATLRPSPSQGSLASGIVQITVLEKVAKGQIGVAAAGTNPRGEAMLVVFFLTKPI